MRNIKRDKADIYFSQWIRLRDRKCLRCGSQVKFNDKGLPVSHENSHFQGRGKENTRFNPNNCCTLCTGCHMYFTAHPAEHTDWQVKRLGQEMVDQLVMASNLYCKKQRASEAQYWKVKLFNDFGVKA